jgi:hypothetical protein
VTTVIESKAPEEVSRAERSKTDLTYLQQRWSRLKTERSSWDGHWQEIAEATLPRSGRFTPTDRNRGEKKHNLIHDNTATTALRTLGAGMMAGATSPARPWFRLTSSDPALRTNHNVMTWLAEVTDRMMRVFAKSNTYRALPQIYGELGAFGTAATIMLPDDDNVIHHYPLTVGQYAIATNAKGQVDTLYRELQMTAAQLIKEFGEANVSKHVKDLIKSNTPDETVNVIHAIEPRADRHAGKVDQKNMPWRSTYFELSETHPDSVLRESGFRRFPALVPRWSVIGGDDYGHGPGMDALGDTNQLQHEQHQKAIAINYQSQPPLQAPSSMKDEDVDLEPGGTTFVDNPSQSSGVRSLFESNLQLDHLLVDIQDVRERINRTYFADLFLLLYGRERQMTATEVAELSSERLLVLGPVLESVHDELLEPMVDMTFDYMLEAGQIPEPPPELQGQDLDIEFVSMLAQAQRAIGANGMDRWLQTVGAVAQMKPEALDLVDTDEVVTTYAQMLGVDPDLVRSKDSVQDMRQAREQANAAKEQALLQEQSASTAKDLSAAAASAPSDVLSQFSGLGGGSR